jgi:hypothetical protein
MMSSMIPSELPTQYSIMSAMVAPDGLKTLHFVSKIPHYSPIEVGMEQINTYKFNRL